jgi:hypothetical protein
MSKRTAYSFTSNATRTRGGVGFATDTRTVYEGDRDPLELRQGDKIHGRGQILDFFEVDETCAHCGEIRPVNIVSLCGTCAQSVTVGDRRNHGAIGDPALQVIARLHRRGLSRLSTVRAALATMDEEEGKAFLRRLSNRL